MEDTVKQAFQEEDIKDQSIADYACGLSEGEDERKTGRLNSYDRGASSQEMDLVELAVRLWRARRFLLKVCCFAAIAGLVVAFSLPADYNTTVKLAPEIEDVSKRMNGLGGLAAMAGINLNASSGADAISPELYPDVVQSTPFLFALFPVRVSIPDCRDSISLYKYIDTYQRKPWWNYVFQAPFEMWRIVQEMFAGGEVRNDNLELFHLTRDQKKVLKALQKRIAVSVDKKSFVITVSVDMQDPVVSACIAQRVVQKLQEYITEYRTRKVKNDLAFTRQVFEEARQTYYQAQQAYAAFEDTNRNLISSSFRTEQDRLKNEMTLAFNVYNTLAQKLEQDKLRVQEHMPVYAVIEPATVPLKPAFPRKWMIVAGALMLGLIVGIGFLYIKDLAEFRKYTLG